MSWLNRVSSFFTGDENSPPRLQSPTTASSSSNTNKRPEDLFTFQFLEPGALAYLRLKSLKGRRPACTPDDLEANLTEFSTYLRAISPDDPAMACVVANFTPFDSNFFSQFGTVLPPFVEYTSAKASAANAISTEQQQQHQHHITPFDRLDKLVQYCATMVTFSNQQKQSPLAALGGGGPTTDQQQHSSRALSKPSRVVLLVFCEENPYDHDLVDYSLLAVTALRMFQGTLQFCDAGEACDIIKDQFNIHQSVRHAASHKSVLTKFRTLFQIPAFAGAKSALVLSRIVLQMPTPLGRGVRGLRLVLDCQGEPVYQSDEMWTQGASPKELVLNVAKISSKIISLYGDCTLTLLRLDQGSQPGLLLRAAFSTLFISSSSTFIEIPASDMDFEPIWKGQPLPAMMFTPRSMKIFVTHQPATKKQESHAQDILRDVDFAELKKMYEEMAEMDPNQAKKIFQESAALAGSPLRNRSFISNSSMAAQNTTSFAQNHNNNNSMNNSHSIDRNSSSQVRTAAASLMPDHDSSSSEQNMSPQSIAAAAVADAKKRQAEIAAEQDQDKTNQQSETEQQPEQEEDTTTFSLEPSQLLYVSVRRREYHGALAECFAEFLAQHKNGSRVRILSESVARPGSLWHPRGYSSSSSGGGNRNNDLNNVQFISNNNYNSGSGGGRPPAAYPNRSSSSHLNNQQHHHHQQELPQLKIKVIPKSQWRTSTGKCQYQDCGVAYGLFSSTGNCHACGLHCCSSCLSEKLELPPEYPDPVSVCPRCHARLQLTLMNHHHQIEQIQQQQQQQPSRRSTQSNSNNKTSNNNNYGSNIHFIDPSPSSSSHDATPATATPTTSTSGKAGYGSNIQFINPSAAGDRPVSPTPGKKLGQQQSNNQQHQLVIKIPVCRKEKWQDPGKVSRCQFQDCRNTFGFWSSGSNCYCCGLVCCAGCITGKTTLPPTYPSDPVPVCSRCYSATEIIKKDAVRHHEQKLKQQQREQQQQQQEQKQENKTERGTAATAALKNMNFRDGSGSRSPQRQQHQHTTTPDMALLLTSPQERRSNAANVSGLGSKKTSFLVDRNADGGGGGTPTASTGSPLTRDRSGGNFLAFKRQQQDQHGKIKSGTSSTPPPSSIDHSSSNVGDEEQLDESPANFVIAGNALGAVDAETNQTIVISAPASAHASGANTPRVAVTSDNNNKHIEGIPVVNETTTNSLENTTTGLDSTQKPPQQHVDPNADNNNINTDEVAPRTRSDTIAPSSKNTEEVETSAAVLEQQPKAETKKPAPVSPFGGGGGGGMAGVFAELQRKAAEKEQKQQQQETPKPIEADKPTPTATEEPVKKEEEKKPEAAEEAVAPTINDPSHPDYYKQGTKTINQNPITPASTLNPPPIFFKPLHLNSTKAIKGKMPPVPGKSAEEQEQEEQQESSATSLEDPYLKPEDEPFRHAPQPNPDYVDDGTKSTLKAPPIKFRPVRNSKTAIKGKMPKVPGAKEEEQEQTTGEWVEDPENEKYRTPQPNPDFVDDGVKSTLKAPPIRFRPIRNSKTAIKGKMPPIPGKPKDDDQNQQNQDSSTSNNKNTPSSPTQGGKLDMGSLAALLQSKLKMAPTASAASKAKAPAPKAAGPKIKTIFWKKLTGEKLRKSALWTMDCDKMSSPHDANQPLIPKAKEEKVRSMFEIKTKEKTANNKDDPNNNKDGKKKSAAVTAQRQQNVGIALKKMRKTSDELKNAILNCDGEVFSAEILDAVLKIMPQDDEIRNLKAEKSAGNYAWAEVEDFLYTIAVQVPDAKERLTLWKTAMEIPRQIDLAEAQLGFQNEAAGVITNEQSDFVRVLRCILNIGNCVNKGTAQGNAGGFTLESLVNTLLGTKATDNKTTLLDLVFEHFGEEEVDKMEFADEMQNKLAPAIGCPVSNVSTLISSIANSVQRLKRIANSKSGDKEEDKLIQLMKESHDQYSGPASDLLLRLQSMKDSVANALEFIGEERTADDTVVFNMMINFCKEFNKHRGVWLRKQQALAKKKQLEEKERQKMEKEKEEKEKKQQQEGEEQKQDEQETKKQDDELIDDFKSPHLRPTMTKVYDPNSSNNNNEENNNSTATNKNIRKEEEGWETTDRKKQESSSSAAANDLSSTPAALFSRIPPPRQVKFDDEDEDR